MNELNKIEGADAAAQPVNLVALLAETVSVQAFGTLAVLVVATLAPEIARDLGVPTAIALVYFAGMIASLGAGWAVGTFGASRTGQLCMLIAGLGCVVASLGSLSLLIIGSFLIGIGYGLINPAASELLIRHSPANRRSMIFSIKQAGVPLGGMIAGLGGPPLALAFGWRSAFLVTAGACVATAVAAQPGRAHLDRDRGTRGGARAPAFSAMRVVLADPALRWLSLSSFCFAGVQLCVVSFLVALLVEELHVDLVLAGAILAVVQVVAGLSRIFWGYVSDLLRDGLGVLVFLALVMIVSAALVMLFGPTLPLAAVVVVFLTLGTSAVGWNGVLLAEVARLSPAQAVSAVTGAAMFFTYTGVVLAPPLFALLHQHSGSYVRSYWLLVALAIGALALVSAVRFRRAP
jgi:MFS family permease